MIDPVPTTSPDIGIVVGDGRGVVGSRRGWAGVALAAALLVAGCAGGRQLLAREEVPQDMNWRRVATVQDRTRLREWRTGWIDALAVARAGGDSAAIAGDPTLYDPDRALGGAALPAGRYRCRMVKLGGKGPATPAVMQGGWTGCAVRDDAGRRTLSIDGQQRYHGDLFDHDDARQVFLGTVALGDETRALPYGRDARRDAAGYLERIGKARWRLILPYPGFDATLDVVEIVPIG